MTAVVLVADGTEETEFVTAYDILVRAGCTVKSIGVNLHHGSFAVCSRGVKIIPDYADFSLLPNLYGDPDVLVVPGGVGAHRFCESVDVLRFVQKLRGQNKWVACICAGPIVLLHAAQLPAVWNRTKCKVTSHPTIKQQLIDADWTYIDEPVVVDDRVITSRGPGTSLLFALTIVETICGKEKRDEVAAPMMLAGGP